MVGENRRPPPDGAIRILFSAPHRIFFLLGTIQLVVSILLWPILLIARYFPAIPAPSLTVGATSAHSFLMLYGLFTFFLFGFLSTVFPR